MTTNFNVIKNINESFSISLPSQFDENLPPSGTIYAYPKFSSSISITTGTLTSIVNSLNNVVLTFPDLEMTPTTLLVGTNQYVYTTTANDCNIATNDTTSFSKTRGHLFFGQNNASRFYKTWIPFAVLNIAKAASITSARLILTSQKTGSHSNVRLKLGCDNRDDCVTGPTNYSDLNSRSMTAAYTDENPFPATTEGYGYLYDVTSSVQEIINRTGWAATQTLAILSIDSGSSGNAYVRTSSFEDSDYQLKFPVTGMSYNGSIVTLICNNYFLSGDKITVSGVNSGYGVVNIDGPWTCDAGTNPLQVVFTVSSPPTGTTPQTTSHGTVSPTPLSVTGMSFSTNTVTLTVANDYNIGTRIHVAGINSGYAVTYIDGDWVCKTGTSVTQVVFDVTHNPSGSTPQSSSHGTVTRAGSPLLVITV